MKCPNCDLGALIVIDEEKFILQCDGVCKTVWAPISPIMLPLGAYAGTHVEKEK
jgi:hypothetical protein